jgi:hypothetical protein
MGRSETLALARTMLRAARDFADYNFRECAPARAASAAALKQGATLGRFGAASADASPSGLRSYAHRRVLAGFRENAALSVRARAAPPRGHLAPSVTARRLRSAALRAGLTTRALRTSRSRARSPQRWRTRARSSS